MKSCKIKAMGILLMPSLLSVFVVYAAKGEDDPLTKLASYKNWTRAKQQLPEGNFSIDPASLGG